MNILEILKLFNLLAAFIYFFVFVGTLICLVYSLATTDKNDTLYYGWYFLVQIITAIPIFLGSFDYTFFCFCSMLLICNVFRYRKNVLVLIRPFDDMWFWKYKEIAFLYWFGAWYKTTDNPIKIKFSGKELDSEIVENISFNLYLTSESIADIYDRLIEWRADYPMRSFIDYREILSEDINKAFKKAFEHTNRGVFKEGLDEKIINNCLRFLWDRFEDFFCSNKKIKLHYRAIEFERVMIDLNKSVLLKA